MKRIKQQLQNKTHTKNANRTHRWRYRAEDCDTHRERERAREMKDNIRLNGTKTKSISETLKYYVPVLIHFQSELARVSIFLLCKSDETKTIKHTTKFFLMICCCSFSFPPHLFLPKLIIHLAHSHFYRFNDRQLVCLARCLPFDLLLLLL